MSLESPNFLHDLNPNNPSFQDFRSEGDDHLRGIKTALKNTFPGMAGRAWRKKGMSASGAITVTDSMTVVHASSGITLTPDPATSLGNGFIFMVRAPSTGGVTINPGEPINGGASYIVPANYTAIITCDGTEFYLMLVFNDIPPSVPAFPSGTRLVFPQTSAPTGWTKQVSSIYNDAAIRVTTGTAGTGGADNFTSTFGTGKTTASRTLTSSEVPATEVRMSGTMAGDGGAFGGIGWPMVDNQDPVGVSGLFMGNVQGGGQGHTHNLNNFNVKYVDVIVASKD